MALTVPARKCAISIRDPPANIGEGRNVVAFLRDKQSSGVQAGS